MAELGCDTLHLSSDHLALEWVAPFPSTTKSLVPVVVIQLWPLRPLAAMPGCIGTHRFGHERSFTTFKVQFTDRKPPYSPFFDRYLMLNCNRFLIQITIGFDSNQTGDAAQGWNWKSD